MGVECGQSSGGSSSCGYRKPFDWYALLKGFGIQTTQFISFFSSLRMRSDLQKRSFMKEESINWHGIDQNPPRWEDLSCKFLVTTLKVDKPENGLSSESSLLEGDMFIAFIAVGHSESVPLPEIPEGMAWHRLVDPVLPFSGFFSNGGEPVI
jgi:hypothetical protein